MLHKTGFISAVCRIVAIMYAILGGMTSEVSAKEVDEPVIVVQPRDTSVDAVLLGTWRVVQIFNHATGVVEPIAEDGSAVTMSFDEFGVSIRGGCHPEDVSGVISQGAYTVSIATNSNAIECDGNNVDERLRFHKSLPGSGYYFVVEDKLHLFSQSGWLRLVLHKNP